MAKLTLNDIAAGYQSNVAANTNNTLIETAIENTLSRDGTGPNQMGANLDMNSNHIINLPAPVDANEAARLQDVQDAISGLPNASLVDADDLASGTLWTTVQGFVNKILSSAGAAVVGFIQTGTGAVTRTLQAKNRDIVSVTDFGAVGDGVTDDSTAFQNALDSRADNLVVTVPPTSAGYRLNSGIVIKGNNKILDGQFSTLTFYGADLTCISLTCTTTGVPELGAGVQDIILDVSNVTGASTRAFVLSGKADQTRNRNIKIAGSVGQGYVVQGGVRLSGGTTVNDSPEKGSHVNIIVRNSNYGIVYTSVPFNTSAYSAIVDYAQADYVIYGGFAYECLVANGPATAVHAPSGTASANTWWSPALTGMLTHHVWENTYVQGTSSGGKSHYIQAVGNSTFLGCGGETGADTSYGLVVDDNGTGGANIFDGGFFEGFTAGGVPNAGNFLFSNPSATYGNVINIKENGLPSGHQSFDGNTLSLSHGLIKFPATAVLSTDANTLDDYEEGTCTLVMGGATSESGQVYSDQTFRYTKIGRQVTVTGYLRCTTPGTVTGNAVIKGLPFTNATAAGSTYYATCPIFAFSGLGVNTINLSGVLLQGTTTMLVYYSAAAAAGLTAAPNTLWQSGTNPDVSFTLTYFTDA